MPLNLNASFKPRIKTCRGWKSHFTGCAREVIGALELLAKNREDRFIFPSVDAVAKLCNKRHGEEQVYSKRTVEKCLQAFRELQILHADNGAVVDCVKRNGWTLNPHDAMTKRYPAACVFIGPGKTSGVWLADGKWQPDEGREEFGLVVEAYPEPSPAASLVRDKSVSGDGAKAYAGTGQKRMRVRDESVSRDGIGCGVGCATENEDLFDIEADSNEPTDESRQEDSSKIEAEPLKPLEPIKPMEPTEPPQPPYTSQRREAREWLSWMWSEVYESLDYEAKEKRGLLRFRQAKGGLAESPDITAIENLIADEACAPGCERDKELTVLLAWTEFCCNFKHDPETKYPITVFLANYKDVFRPAVTRLCNLSKHDKQMNEAMGRVLHYLDYKKSR